MAQAVGSAAFWSYSHEDNEADGGRILALAEGIRNEVSLLSGESFQLFVDRDGIEWGDAWRERINNALVETTLFIPLVTPRYFDRHECVRELLEFHGQARSLGLEEFVLPIRYIGVPGLAEDSPIPAVATIARLQYVDWEKLRLLDTSSADYRSAVNALALRIIALGQKVREIQQERELNADPDVTEPSGVAELLDRLGLLLPDWLAAVEDDEVNFWQNVAVDDVYQRRVARLTASRAPASQILATHVKEAQDTLPLAERRLAGAQLWASRTVELDPVVLELLRLVAGHPELGDLIHPLRRAVAVAVSQMEVADLQYDKAHRIEAGEYFRRKGHVSRISTQVSRAFEEGNRLVQEGNEIVLRWSALLEELPESPVVTP